MTNFQIAFDTLAEGEWAMATEAEAIAGTSNTVVMSPLRVDQAINAAIAEGQVSIPKGYLQITSLNAAVGLTVPSGSRRVLIRVEGQAVRWRDDGVDPTPLVGMLIDAGAELNYDGDLSAITFIEVNAPAAKLNCSFYG